MKRVKGVEDLNICIIGAQGIVGVGACLVTGGGVSNDGRHWHPPREPNGSGT
jgi:hypothetical protein